MKITAIPQLYRNLRRWREILKVLRRYGLADWLSQYRRFPFRDSFKDRGGVPLSEYSREQRVRMALTELGPTFIKLGQILAGRPDLVGAELGDELKNLRSNVQPDSIETVRQTLSTELGEDYESHFQSISPTPLATASIGQVHRAKLNDGRHVVLKVQRHGIEQTIRQDIEVLGGLAQLAQRVDTLAAWGPSDIVSQLAPMITREMDFGRERQNLDYFADMLADSKHAVTIPRPIKSLCTKRVMVMDELQGQPLADFLAESRANANDTFETALTKTTTSKQDIASVRKKTKQALSETIASVYLTMLFDHGVFHADPHSGNLYVLDDGSLGILDFGMTGRIGETLRETIEEMLVAISGGDQNRLTRLIRRIGNPPPTLDDAALSIDVAEFIGTFGRQNFGEFDLTGALNELSAILHAHAIKLPNQSALLLKMLISLEGTLRELDASFDSLDVVKKFMRKTMIRRMSPQRRIRQARRIYLEAENFMETAPDELLALAQQARRGEIRVNLEHQRLGPSVNRLVLGLMASAVFLGSSLLLAMKVPPLFFVGRSVLGMQDLSIMGIAGLTGSVTVMMWLLIAINRSGHLTRDNDN
ncbi:MAG: AarF/UbiB family protein [Pirellulaceae bacterium]